MEKIRVAIVDDQKLFAKSLKNVIESRSENIEVIKVLIDGQSALEYLTGNQPDLLLLDIRLPDINGVKIAKIVRDSYPEVKILMLTTFGDEEYVQGALANGAGGYLLKDIEPEELITSIYVVMSGNILISPEALPKLIKRIKLIDRYQEQMGVDFTRREEEVITLVLKGLSNKEIGSNLNIAEQTVKNQLHTIYVKCDVKNRSALVHCINRISLRL